MKKVLIISLLAFFLVGCTQKERISTIDQITYQTGKVTVLFNDGMVITTHLYEDGMEPGDEVWVRHLSNGNIEIAR